MIVVCLNRFTRRFTESSKTLHWILIERREAKHRGNCELASNCRLTEELLHCFFKGMLAYVCNCCKNTAEYISVRPLNKSNGRTLSECRLVVLPGVKCIYHEQLKK